MRPTKEDGDSAVVLLYMKVASNNQIRERTCSGTLIAPRVVLTAAHCLANVWQNQLFAYWGDDFAVDFAALPKAGQSVFIPAPGQASLFAQADSFEVHPKWDANLVHPDLGLVYLDRKPPVAPLPVARFPLGREYVNHEATLVGWGANAALSADLSQTSGGRVLRSGKTRILGSPTAADYHADDPNPGMLVPAVRRNTLKTDGRAPYSNTCAGDSGSPLLVRSGCGERFVAGVSSWTGLWCENYSLFARIDPFIDFIDRGLWRGGHARIEPELECVNDNGDGSLTAYFGYDNDNGVSVDVPLGLRNSLSFDKDNHRLTHFLPGHHAFAFGVDFTPRQQLLYVLAPEAALPSVLTVSKRSPRCGPAVAPQVACGGFCRAGFAAGCSDALPSDSQCMSDCLNLLTSFPDCAAQATAMNQCYAATPPGEEHWLCNGDDFMPSSLDCGDQESAFYSCLFGG